MKCILFFLTFLSFDAWGGSNFSGTYYSNRVSRFSLYGNYTLYQDIQHSDTTNPAETFGPEYNVHLDIRLMRIFSIKTLAGVAMDNSTMFYGLGVKADLPGFFFLGGEVNDLIHKRRGNPFNSYAEWSMVFYDFKNGESPTAANRIGLGIDLFLVHRIFLNMSVSAMTLRNNVFISPAVGLGWEF